VDELISEVMISPFLASDARLQLASKLLSLRSNLDTEPVTESAQLSRENYRLTTVAISVVGALAFGAAAAASSYLKSWVPFAIVGFLAFTGIVFTQAGDRIARLRFGSASIEFASRQPTINISSYGDGVTFHTEGENIIGQAPTDTSPGDRITEDGTASESSKSAPAPNP
jgi:hypothetical protein